MNILVVGLGLIGGSFCKAIKRYTAHSCWGLDNDPDTIRQALNEGVIDAAVGTEQLEKADLTIVCLHPQATLDFIRENGERFSAGNLVMDTCGVKEVIVAQCAPLLKERGVTFIGAHPMAGREYSGFSYSLTDLFVGASLILTPDETVPSVALDTIRQLAVALGFTNIVLTTPLIHDQTIAFTSQLAHVVSNAYIKSPTLDNESGFSAGSFLDLTRVAKLNEHMWTELFMFNKTPLIHEIEHIMGHLEEYRQALLTNNAAQLEQLLRDGRILKEKSLKSHNLALNMEEMP